MSFTLHVDAPRWRTHLDSVRDAVRGVVRAGLGPAGTGESGELVPVAKGNGYGFGIGRLAREATRLGVPLLAVGTVFELEHVAAFDADLLVMTPYEPADTVAAATWEQTLAGPLAGRLVRTVASVPALRAVAAAPAGTRIVVEGLTSTGRFGLTPQQLAAELSSAAVRRALDAGTLVLEGLALHLPLTQPVADHRSVPGASWRDAPVEPAPPAGASARVREVLAWAHGWSALLGQVQAGQARTDATGTDGASANGADTSGSTTEVPATRIAALTRAPSLWLSHLADDELAVLRAALPGVPLRPRIGTRLWLGDRGAVTARGTVLAVHPQQRGDRAGYRQRRAGRDGTLLVVSGGTAHGVALTAPTPGVSSRQRLVAAGSGLLEAGGRALSPFTIAGRQRWFAEPPHMHVSLVRLPADVPVPAVGDLVPCEVRMTTATFDRVLGLD